MFSAKTDQWILEQGPMNSVVVSSRARLARNLPKVPFAPRANPEQLRHIAATIGEALEGAAEFRDFQKIDLTNASSTERCFLRESHLISSELEKGGTGRIVYVSPAMDASIMINEEDHLRLSTLISGFRIDEAYLRLSAIESALERVLDLAYSPEFGYLTACPTNTGTGLRLSVMMHLPALALIGQVDDVLAPLGSYGLIVRGAYGEHSEHAGDLYQISNEVTLGKSEMEIMQILEKIVRQVIEREQRAREALGREAREKVEDIVCRAVGLLSMARRIDSNEAITLLSRMRLGLDESWGIKLSHAELSRLFVDIQPAHLQCIRKAEGSPEARDAARAELLRRLFGEGRNN